MTILMRYIFFRLLGHTAVTMAVVALVLFVWLLSAKIIDVHDYEALSLLAKGNLFALPTAMCRVFPVVLFFSVLRFVAKMKQDCEWMAMTTLGYNTRSMLLAANLAILTACFTVVVADELFAPYAMSQATQFFCSDHSIKKCPLRQTGWVFNQQQMIHYNVNLVTDAISSVTIYNLNEGHNKLNSIIFSRNVTHDKHNYWLLTGRQFWPGHSKLVEDYRLKLPFSRNDVDLFYLKIRHLPIWLYTKMYVANNFYRKTSLLKLAKMLIDNFIWLFLAVIMCNIFIVDFLSPLPTLGNRNRLILKTGGSIIVIFLLSMLYKTFFLI